MCQIFLADNGSLRNYLDTNYNKLSWVTKIRHLWYIANGLRVIHEKELNYILAIY